MIPPASRTHNDPQLVDTPTRRAAAAPFTPCRINSKYRRFTAAEALLCPPRGTRTSPRGVRNHRWNSSRVQRPVLPLGHALDDLVGDRGDRLPRDIGPVDLAQVGLDLAGGQPLGRQRDDQLVDTGQPPLTFGD